MLPPKASQSAIKTYYLTKTLLLDPAFCRPNPAVFTTKTWLASINLLKPEIICLNWCRSHGGAILYAAVYFIVNITAKAAPQQSLTPPPSLPPLSICIFNLVLSRRSSIHFDGNDDDDWSKMTMMLGCQWPPMREDGRRLGPPSQEFKYFLNILFPNNLTFHLNTCITLFYTPVIYAALRLCSRTYLRDMIISAKHSCQMCQPAKKD